MRMKGLFVAIALVAAPTLASAQHEHPPSNAAVDFGVLPTPTPTGPLPIGPRPCFQPGDGVIGGPFDPCSYKLHVLTPEEVTIDKGGQVTFQVHGGGHGFAIYEVSENTTRQDLGQFLCEGTDPAEIPDPADNPCNLLFTNSDAMHTVMDGKGDVVLVAQAATTAHPDNRVWSEPGRLMSAGAMQFLNGGTIPAGPMSNGQLLTYRFQKTGRYLVLCINRVHFLNDWMFGFVNVR